MSTQHHSCDIHIHKRRHRRRLSAPTVPTSPALRLRLHHSYHYRHPTASINNFATHFSDKGDHPRTLDALDLTSPAHTLASLRFLVLTYLASLEQRLYALASGSTPSASATVHPQDSDLLTQDTSTKQWAQKALLILQSIRTDVCSHLPDIRLHNLDAIAFVKSHLPDFHLPEFPIQFPEFDLPDLDTLRTRFHDLDLDFEPPMFSGSSSSIDVSTPSGEVTDTGLGYIDTLTAHLAQLHSHLSSFSLADTPAATSEDDASPQDLARTLEQFLQDARSKFMSSGSEFVSDIQNLSMIKMDNVLTSAHNAMSTVENTLENALTSVETTLESALDQGEEMLERAERVAVEVGLAVQRSLEGVRLIGYADLPKEWRNNPFVGTGYRFIPKERWELLVLSLFKWHNEFLNIHTHLIPFLIWLPNIISVVWNISSLPALPMSSFLSSHLPSLSFLPYPRSLPLPLTHLTHLTPLNSSTPQDAPELLFMSFALLCLFSSAVWHTMAGCADHRSMEFCARVDYVGIGWLISASVGTVVYYGFQDCHPELGWAFLGLCLCTGIAGNVFPFMKWFNMHEYRLYRIGFFLSLAFSAVGPTVVLGMLHSYREVYEFIAPVFPSLLSYTIGLLFYAAHFPECILPESVRRKLDVIGGGSHAIWHCFIVLAVSQHKSAIGGMKGGLGCVAG